MKKVLFILLLIEGLLSMSKASDNNYVPGEMIVMLKPGHSTADLSHDFGFAGLKVKETVVEYMNIWLFEFNNNSYNDSYLLNEVRRNSNVAVAQFNHYVTERSVPPIIPNDPSFGVQWSLNNTGQNGGTPDADIDGPEAWNLTTSGLTAAGDTIVVAIIDDGFSLTHIDLRFWKNWYEIPSNGIDDDANGYIDDVNGWNAYNNTGNITTTIQAHGMHVSGIAGAAGNNSIGIAGVNWNIKIMGIQGSSGQEVVVLRAYGYALKQRRIYDQTNGQRGAFVVSTNSSFGVDYGQPSNYPLWCAFYDSLGTKGILNACATANLNINIDSLGDIPTACPSEWMVSVTNTTNIDKRNSGAAYGHLTIDLGAPGTSIYSTLNANNYGTYTGTSMATPHVAGAIAFMYNVAPLWWIQGYKTNPGPYSLVVKQKILQGVDPKPSLQDSTVSGGRLNLYNSALLIQNLVAVNNNNSSVPEIYRLYQNYPNPFNPSTIISFDIPKDGFVSLKVYNTLGQEAAVIADGIMKAGSYQKVFRADNLPSGVYFYKLVTDSYSDTRKMTIIK